MKFLKEYLPLIIVIPTFLGGIWQILELSIISMSYVRFFSISQLVADGILIIMIIFPLIIGFMFFIEKYEFIKNDSTVIKNNMFLNIFLFFIIVLVFYISWIFLLQTIKNIGIDTYLGYLILVMYIYLILFMLLVFLSKIFISCIEFILKIFKTKAIPYTLIMILFFFMLFHYIFFIPKNLENITNLPKGKIKYFNDKYIFIENEENKNIIVVKFDELFSHSASPETVK